MWPHRPRHRRATQTGTRRGQGGARCWAARQFPGADATAHTPSEKGGGAARGARPHTLHPSTFLSRSLSTHRQAAQGQDGPGGGPGGRGRRVGRGGRAPEAGQRAQRVSLRVPLGGRIGWWGAPAAQVDRAGQDAAGGERGEGGAGQGGVLEGFLREGRGEGRGEGGGERLRLRFEEAGASHGRGVDALADGPGRGGRRRVAGPGGRDARPRGPDAHDRPRAKKGGRGGGVVRARRARASDLAPPPPPPPSISLLCGALGPQPALRHRLPTTPSHSPPPLLPIGA